MEWAQLPAVQLGALGVLLIVILAVITGRLVPRGTVNSLREGDKLTIQRQEEEIKEWRTAWIAESMIKRELVTQVNDLTRSSGRVTEAILGTNKESPK